MYHVQWVYQICRRGQHRNTVIILSTSITQLLNNWRFVLRYYSALFSKYGLADSTVGQFRQKNSSYIGQSCRINCGETTKQNIFNNNALNTDHSVALRVWWWGTQYGPMGSQWWVHCCRRPRHWPWRGIANSHCCYFDCHWLRPIKLWDGMTEWRDGLVRISCLFVHEVTELRKGYSKISSEIFSKFVIFSKKF